MPADIAQNLQAYPMGNRTKRLQQLSPVYVHKNLSKILYLIFDYPHKHYTFKHFEI